MTVSDYAGFLASKALVVRQSGLDVVAEDIHPSLFGFQRDLVRWSLRKGRAALFATTGMGKTRMQVEWARLTGERALILAPLAVARQTVREGASIGVTVTYARCQANAAPDGITITNYEMLHAFDPSAFGAVVLDESGILKNFDGKVRTQLIRAFRDTPYRLCATATPAPNDIAELANHAEFLGIMKREEMLAAFFVHDDTGWRLKGHAREPFYRWLASWGMSLMRPSDLGYSDDGYELPPLEITATLVPTSWTRTGQLFATDLKGITDRAAVRRDTLSERVKAAAELINGEPDEPWIAWVGLNDEGRELAALVSGSVLVEGADSPEEKADAIERFVHGDVRVIVSKTSIFGFGLNLQRCARMAFVGLSDSYEQYFQAIRRCWRYGQTRPVHAYIVLTEPEEVIYANVCRKQREAEIVGAELVKHVAAFERAEIAAGSRSSDMPHGQPMVLPQWLGVAS
jgi:superfamily II DNA or RNA helicase